MTTIQMRVALTKLYPGPKWSNKVSKMSDQQVFATHTRLKLAGKL